MKYIPCIAGGLLGALFLMASIMFFMGKMPPEQVVSGSYEEHFGKAFGPSGYMYFVKVCELVGGILVAIPKTRNFGLLVLGPIIANILAYTICIKNGAGLTHPMLIGICVLALYLLIDARKKFLGLLN